MGMRRIRTKMVWLLVPPFLWFAQPTRGLLILGALLAAGGLFIRGWAAGTIHKDEDLTTSGPYAYTRNPLYIGSCPLGLGVVLAGGHWVWPALFLVFFIGVYGRTMSGETELLAELFGDRFEHYAENVPALLPRLTPYRPQQPDVADGFRLRQYKRNNEWEALLGAGAAFAFLASKRMWFG
jgi:protein-S-isoprenylcysteine O-methyltransferase Ste14